MKPLHLLTLVSLIFLSTTFFTLSQLSPTTTPQLVSDENYHKYQLVEQSQLITQKKSVISQEPPHNLPQQNQLDTLQFTPLHGHGEEEKPHIPPADNLHAAIIALVAIFVLLFIILGVAIYTEAHEVLCAFLARKHEHDHEVTDGQRFENQLKHAVPYTTWEPQPPGERSAGV